MVRCYVGIYTSRAVMTRMRDMADFTEELNCTEGRPEARLCGPRCKEYPIAAS